MEKILSRLRKGKIVLADKNIDIPGYNVINISVRRLVIKKDDHYIAQQVYEALPDQICVYGFKDCNVDKDCVEEEDEEECIYEPALYCTDEAFLYFKNKDHYPNGKYNTIMGDNDYKLESVIIKNDTILINDDYEIEETSLEEWNACEDGPIFKATFKN